MSDFSDYLENELLDHVFRNASYTPPTTVYLGLYTVAPTDSGGGTEVSGGGYARQAVTFGAASGGSISNSGEVAWTASGANYGTIVAVGVFDASTSGNLLAWKTVTNQSVDNGQTYRFQAGQFAIALA